MCCRVYELGSFSFKASQGEFLHTQDELLQPPDKQLRPQGELLQRPDELLQRPDKQLRPQGELLQRPDKLLQRPDKPQTTFFPPMP